MDCVTYTIEIQEGGAAIDWTNCSGIDYSTSMSIQGTIITICTNNGIYNQTRGLPVVLVNTIEGVCN